MAIQATISKLQSDIKRNSDYIAFMEERKKFFLGWAKETPDGNLQWRNYHYWKDCLNERVKQQKINKSLYKLMCEIQKQMPNGSISMYEIREI